VINAIKFSIEEIEASDQYFDHTGSHHLVMNSQATSVTSLRLYQSAIAACFVFWREFCRTAFWDFCNKICQ
jgi:hypothetical protein